MASIRQRFWLVKRFCHWNSRNDTTASWYFKNALNGISHQATVNSAQIFLPKKKLVSLLLSITMTLLRMLIPNVREGRKKLYDLWQADYWWLVDHCISSWYINLKINYLSSSKYITLICSKSDLCWSHLMNYMSFWVLSNWANVITYSAVNTKMFSWI